MTNLELFLAIVCLAGAVVCGIGYQLSSKHMFVRNRRKRYVRAPRKGQQSRTIKCKD